MAEKETVRLQMKAADFVDVAFERVDAPVLVGNPVEDSTAFQLALGPAGEIYREDGDVATERHDDLVAEMTDCLQPFITDDGIIMNSSSWVVSARDPS